MTKRLKVILAAGWVALAPLPAAAQGPDAAKLDELRRVVEQQQKMIEAQARTLEALKSQVETLRATTQTNMRAVTAATQKVEQTTETVRQVVRQVEQADTPPKMITSGSDKVKLAISGQVNRALLLASDGDQTDLFHVDNDHSSTRVRFVGEARPMENLTAGAIIEVQFESNSSANVDQGNVNADETTNSFTERKLEVFFKHRKFGNLWIGQGDPASNITSEVDLSGTTVVLDNDVNAFAGGLLFRRSDTGALTTIQVKNVFNTLDGITRDDRIRYDTPKFLGFYGSASHVQGGENDYALRYSAKWDEFKTAAAIGYANLNATGTIESRLDGSASVLHGPTGLSLTMAAGRDDSETQGRADARVWYGKLGWQRNFFNFGKTAMALDYTFDKNQGQNDDEFTSIGAGVVQKVDSWGTEFYAGYRWMHLNRSAVPVDDLNAGLFGARVKF